MDLQAFIFRNTEIASYRNVSYARRGGLETLSQMSVLAPDIEC